MIEIRRIHVNEAPLVRDMVREATEEQDREHPQDRIGISDAGLANLETQFRLGAAHGDEVTLVAVDDGAIVGFVSGSLSRSRATPGVAGEIDWHWVRPGARGAGIDRRLAEAAIAWLRTRGAGPVYRFDDASHPGPDPWIELGFEADVIRFSLYDEAAGGC